MWKYFNPNPTGRNVGDCAVRALSAVTGMDWEAAFCELCSDAYYMGDMPSSNSVIAAALRKRGFYRLNIPSTFPEDYTAEDFCKDHPEGVFVLGFGNHVAGVVDGTIFDSWDSSNEIPQYFWWKKGEGIINDF